MKRKANWIEVWVQSKNKWEKMVLVDMYSEGAVCVDKEYEDYYFNNLSYLTSTWSKWREVKENIDYKTMKLKWKKLMQPNVVVNCKTKEESDIFLKLLSKKSTYVYNFDVWDQFKDKTCYRLLDTEISTNISTIHDSINYYKGRSYIIYDFSEVIKRKKSKESKNPCKPYKLTITDGFDTWEFDIDDYSLDDILTICQED